MATPSGDKFQPTDLLLNEVFAGGLVGSDINQIRALVDTLKPEGILARLVRGEIRLSYKSDIELLKLKDPKSLETYSETAYFALAGGNGLIVGEPGVGKELIARLIHKLGAPAGPLIVVNCPTLPKDLAESELFGSDKGAFTGASASRQGLIEAADNGIMLLDEISEMDLSMQAKLLRVLQEGMVRRVGTQVDKPVKVRFIATSNRPLEELTSGQRLRTDLLGRLSEGVINVSPLRERREDIEVILNHYLRKFLGNEHPPVSKAIETEFKEYPWPGNVRELVHVIKRAIRLAAKTNSERVGDSELLRSLEQSRRVMLDTPAGRSTPHGHSEDSFMHQGIIIPRGTALDHLERSVRAYVEDVWYRNGRNVSATARALRAKRDKVRYALNGNSGLNQTKAPDDDGQPDLID